MKNNAGLGDGYDILIDKISNGEIKYNKKAILKNIEKIDKEVSGKTYHDFDTRGYYVEEYAIHGPNTLKSLMMAIYYPWVI